MIILITSRFKGVRATWHAQTVASQDVWLKWAPEQSLSLDEAGLSALCFYVAMCSFRRLEHRDPGTGVSACFHLLTGISTTSMLLSACRALLSWSPVFDATEIIQSLCIRPSQAFDVDV